MKTRLVTVEEKWEVREQRQEVQTTVSRSFPLEGVQEMRQSLERTKQGVFVF